MKFRTYGVVGRPNAIKLVLQGKIVSKKNRLRPRRGPGKGKMYDPAIKAAIDALDLQARAAWGARRALVHPTLDIFLFVANEAKDTDGMYTTILDVLKKAGVIFDDSIKYCNGLKRIHPAVIVPAAMERVEIVLEVPINA